MAKSGKSKKKKIPKEGDTVYLIGEPKSPAMFLKKIVIKDKIKYGTCIWTTQKLKEDGELKHLPHEGEFHIENLTTEVPPFPTRIYKY